MPRPCCKCHVRFSPSVTVFKPAGIPARELEWVEMTTEELEALRLADLEGYYQENAAAEMKVSRPTFSRIVARARQKVAEALIQGKALAITPAEVATRSEVKLEDSSGCRGPERKTQR